MAEPPLPATTADITPEWLSHALAGGGVSGGAVVRSFERETIGADAGFLGELSRLTITYDRPAPAAPATLVSKLPTTDDTVRTMAQLFGFYEREVRFYQELAHRVEVRTPRPYYSGMDTDSGRFVLLLEDLAPGRCGDQLASCSLDEARLALREVAKLHAAWWNDPRAAELSWLPAIGDPLLTQVIQTLYQQSWPFFVQTLGDRVPALVLEVGERFGANFGALAETAAGQPFTITHTDFRLDNMFFDLPDGSPLAVIDWQLVQRGSGLVDVTYFLAGNLPPEVRREHELALLRTYHEQLLRGGVSGYDFAQCQDDYRRAALFLLIFIVTNREDVDFAAYGERAQSLMDTMLERYTTAIQDLDAGEFLPR